MRTLRGTSSVPSNEALSGTRIGRALSLPVKTGGHSAGGGVDGAAKCEVCIIQLPLSLYLLLIEMHNGVGSVYVLNANVMLFMIIDRSI